MKNGELKKNLGKSIKTRKRQVLKSSEECTSKAIEGKIL